jgi:hypothetical protein
MNRYFKVQDLQNLEALIKSIKIPIDDVILSIASGIKFKAIPENIDPESNWWIFEKDNYIINRDFPIGIDA